MTHDSHYSTDILDDLRRFAPDGADLAARLHQHSAPRSRRRLPSGRARVVASLATIAAAAAVVVPATLPDGTPGAADPAAAVALHRLATIAENTPADTLAPGQFVRTVATSHQVGVPENPELGAEVIDNRDETWTAYDGRSWIRRTYGGHADPSIWSSKKDRESGAAYFDSLPTDPEALGRYLRRHAHGSSSRDEAVFLAVGAVMANDTAPADLRSAAATVLADTPHVRLGSIRTDAVGRGVTEFDFVDESIRPGQVQAFYVDRATAQVVGQSTTQPGSTYAGTTLSSEVVDRVPPAVLRDACPISGRIC